MSRAGGEFRRISGACASLRAQAQSVRDRLDARNGIFATRSRLDFSSAEICMRANRCWMVSYWKSMDQLLAYAELRAAEHLPAWRPSIDTSAATATRVHEHPVTRPETIGLH